MKIYTDGACSINSDFKGGWGVIVTIEDKPIVSFGNYSEKTTNNIMELKAVIEAIKYGINNINNNKEITIYTDSAYISNCIKQKWYIKWRQNGWITSSNTLVANRELWEELLTFYENYDIINIEKVKGHNNVKFNEEADNIAVYCKKNQINYYKEY